MHIITKEMFNPETGSCLDNCFSVDIRPGGHDQLVKPTWSHSVSKHSRKGPKNSKGKVQVLLAQLVNTNVKY